MATSLETRIKKIELNIPKQDPNKQRINDSIIYEIRKFKAQNAGELFTINKAHEETRQLMREGKLAIIPMRKCLSRVELMQRIKIIRTSI